jgi:hypothetical protein
MISYVYSFLDAPLPLAQTDALLGAVIGVRQEIGVRPEIGARPELRICNRHTQRPEVYETDTLRTIQAAAAEGQELVYATAGLQLRCQPRCQPLYQPRCQPLYQPRCQPLNQPLYQPPVPASPPTSSDEMQGWESCIYRTYIPFL